MMWTMWRCLLATSCVTYLEHSTLFWVACVMEDSYLVDPPVVICLSQRLCHACARGLHCQNLYDSTWVHQKGFYAKKQIYLSPCISTYIHISHIYIYLHLNITSMNMYVHTLHPFIHAYWLNINICTNICKYVQTHTYMHYILHTY